MVQCLLTGDPVPFALTPKVTNERSLDAAVKYASEFLNKAVKPVLVGGVKMRWPGKAQDAFLKLSEAGEPLRHIICSNAETNQFQHFQTVGIMCAFDTITCSMILKHIIFCL